jgi:AraC-like DNA-binding protein
MNGVAIVNKLLYISFLLIMAGGNVSASFQDDLLSSAIQEGRLRTALSITDRRLSGEDRMTADQKAYYYINRCEAFRRLGNQSQAKQQVVKLLRLLPLVRDSFIISLTRLEIANYYMAENEFEKSMEYINQLMDYVDRTRHPVLLLKMHRVLGSILSMSSKPQEALPHFLQAYAVSKQRRYSPDILSDELNLSITYLSLMRVDSALIHLTSAKHLSENSVDTVSVILNHAIWAAYYQLQQQLPECRQSIEKSIALAAEIEHFVMLSNAYSMLSSLEISLGNYARAIELGKQALDWIEDENLPIYRATIDSLLYEAYKGTGDYSLAMKHFESFYRTLADVRNQTHMEAIQAQREAFLVREKNLLIRNQQLQLAMSRRKQRLMVVVIIFMAFLIGLSWLISWLRRNYQQKLFQKEKMMDNLLQAEKSRQSYAVATQIDSVALADTENATADESLEVFSEDRKDLYDEMLRVIETQKLYLNPDFNQKLLVTMLGTNRRYLYQAISQHAEDNFAQIINRYRLNEAKRLIEDSIDAGDSAFRDDLYLAAGFNSPSSCYRAFKYFTGLTPREYHLACRQEYLRNKQP